jgi:hypothetical protein
MWRSSRELFYDVLPTLAWRDIGIQQKARSGEHVLKSRFEMGPPEYEAGVLDTPPIVLQNSNRFNKQSATELAGIARC